MKYFWFDLFVFFFFKMVFQFFFEWKILLYLIQIANCTKLVRRIQDVCCWSWVNECVHWKHSKNFALRWFVWQESAFDILNNDLVFFLCFFFHSSSSFVLYRKTKETSTSVCSLHKLIVSFMFINFNWLKSKRKKCLTYSDCVAK